MDIVKIGKLIKQERVRRGITQEDLGVKLGVGKAQISKIESGMAMNVKTITRVTDVLGMTLDIKLMPQRELSSKVAGFVIACIGEFAKSYNLTLKEASNYLKRYKGLEFLTLHYEAQHLLGIDDSVDDLARVCRNNGGGLL